MFAFSLFLLLLIDYGTKTNPAGWGRSYVIEGKMYIIFGSGFVDGFSPGSTYFLKVRWINACFLFKLTR